MRYVIARGVAGVLGRIRRMGVMGGMGVFAGEAPAYHGESGWEEGVSLGGGGVIVFLGGGAFFGGIFGGILFFVQYGMGFCVI